MEENVQSPQLQIDQAIPSTPESKNKNTKYISIILTLVLIIISLGGYILLSSQEKSKVTQVPEINQPTQSFPITQEVQETDISNNLPTANVNTLAGKLVYTYNNTIFVSNSDGSNAVKLVDGKNKPGFAGWSNGGKIFYYTELSGATFTLYKKDLTSNISSKVFDFEGSDKNVEFYSSNAHVSSDEKFVIYSRAKDIHLYNLTNGLDKKLLTHKECLAKTNSNTLSSLIVKPVYASTTDCYGYYFPKWSPDNQRVVIRKILYEGAVQIVINPFENNAQEKDMKQGGIPSWSSVDRLLAIAGSGYGPGSLYLISNVDSPIAQDIFLNNSVFKNRYVGGATWSSDKRIAFSFADDNNNQNGIAIYDTNTGVIKPLISTLNEINYDLLWMTDNKTILFSDENKNIWALDSITLSKQKLPVKADTIIEIIQ